MFFVVSWFKPKNCDLIRLLRFFFIFPIIFGNQELGFSLGIGIWAAKNMDFIAGIWRPCRTNRVINYSNKNWNEKQMGVQATKVGIWQSLKFMTFSGSISGKVSQATIVVDRPKIRDRQSERWIAVNEHEWPTRGCGLQWHHHKQKIAGRVGMSYEWTMQHTSLLGVNRIKQIPQHDAYNVGPSETILLINKQIYWN